MHPRYEINKVYIAKINGIMSGADIEQLRNGIIIDGIKTSPARIKVKK